MKDRTMMVCASLCLCVGLLGLGALAWAGDPIDDYLAERRTASGLSTLPRVDGPESLRVAPPPMEMQRYDPPPEEPRRSMRPPWLQPADRMAPMSAEESRRLFCVAPNDCWFDQR